MSRPWLITYDIASPKRLVRLHRALKRHGLPIQYSVFFAELTEARLAEVEAVIAAIIDPGADDVRLYALPRNGWACALGRKTLPGGIEWTGLPSRLRPLPLDPSDEEGDESKECTAPTAPLGTASLTRAQKGAVRDLQARVQTGDKRGITLLG